jgi:acetyl esterase/lipase
MRLVKHIVLVVAGLAQLCGCSGAGLIDLTIPHTGYKLHKDIAYGPGARHQLDVYVPETPDPSKGVVVFFYGGSWQKGSKDIYRFVGQKFASEGFVTVIADYRLYPKAYFPDFIQDGAQAVSWVRKHIGQYGGDPKNIFLSGHSAGAYIAVMLTVNDDYLKAIGGNSTWIRGTIGIAGPYDFLPFTDPKIKAIFSTASDERTQPITYAAAGAPPMLLLSGDSDPDVGVKNTKNLAAKLREAGSPVQVRVYPEVEHIGIILGVADGFEDKAPTLQDMLTFIREHGKS